MQNVGGRSTLLKAIEPFQWVLGLLTLSLPPPLIARGNAKVPRRIGCIWLSFGLCALLLWALGLCGSVVSMINIYESVVRYKLDVTYKVLSTGTNFAICVVQLLLQLSAVLNRHKLREMYADLAQLEQDVGRHCRTQQHLFEPSVWRRVWAPGPGGLLLLLLLQAAITFPLVSTNITLLQKVSVCFFYFLVQLKFVEYCVWVRLLQLLLRPLQLQLLQLRRELCLRERRVHRQGIYAELRVNQQLLARLWRLVYSLEQYYGLPMLLLFLFNSLNVLDTVNWAYLLEFQMHRVYYGATTILTMLIPCWLSQGCINTYERFGTILHHLKTEEADVALDRRLREYSLQLMHLKLVFACCGFFNIDLKCYGCLMLTLSTYTVILLQFKLQMRNKNTLI